MASLDKEGFKIWLKENYSASDRVIRDTISRADRVRRAFQEFDPDFSYEEEIRRDNGISFCNLISHRGLTIKKKISLPVGTNQMDCISSSAKKYLVYLRQKKQRGV